MTFVSISARRNFVKAFIECQGMLQGSWALKFLNSTEKIQPKIMTASFKGNPRKTIFCYCPTKVSDEKDLDNLYNELSSLVRSIPKHNVLFIEGEINTLIGKNENIKFSLHCTSNRNGEHLTDFSHENRLTCRYTKFQKRKGKLWTYTYANKTKAQIDQILMNKNLIISSLNCAYVFLTVCPLITALSQQKYE